MVSFAFYIVQTSQQITSLDAVNEKTQRKLRPHSGELSKWIANVVFQINMTHKVRGILVDTHIYRTPSDICNLSDKQMAHYSLEMLD